ncbi:amidohydrolase [Pseudaquabacterium pictum]
MIALRTLRMLFRPSGRLARALAPTLMTLQAAWVPAGAAQAQPHALAPAIDAQVARHYPGLEQLYQDLHAHPELGFQEVQTAAKLAAAMRAAGFTVTEQVGRTGLVALLRNGPGPTILVRTDMDALPMEEKTGLPYASHVQVDHLGRQTFVAHSCGHDLHMAGWVGTALTLAALKDRWQGTLMFIAQPAEELLGGAKAMLADGLFQRFGKPDFAFALHTWPMAHGEIGFNVGAVTSNADAFELTFNGRGAHGSAPDKSIDPLLMASRFVVDVQGVVSREKDPFQFGVLSVGAIQGGTSGNIIPDSALLRGTLRSYDPAVRTKLRDGLRRTALATATMAGAPEPKLTITPGGDATVNDARLVERAETVLKAAFGAQVKRMPPITPSEDFAEFGSAGVPSMFFLVGVLDPKDVEAARQPGGKPVPGNHSPFFAPVPEPSIKTAVKAMSLAVLSALQR